MGHVFVSYSRRNKELVDGIVTEMEKEGLSVWIDREDIKAGKSWRVQIVEAIDTCDAFVLMLSSHSALSENVQKEIDLAQDSGRKTFVVLLEQIKLPAEIKYQLAGLQFIDVEELGLDESIKRLNATLKEHIAKQDEAKKKTQQAELVIEGVDIKAFDDDKKAQLLAFVAQLANTDQSNLRIANLAAGSVHVFVDMPAYCAFQLKTHALNKDKRFKQLGITSLKLYGDAFYIYIPMGIFMSAAKIGLLKLLWLKLPALLSSLFGNTIGRILTLFLITGAIAAVGISIPTTIIPTYFPSPTPTPTNTPTSTPTSTPTLTFTPSATPTSTFTPIPTFTFTPSFTPTLDRSPNAFFEFIDGNTGNLTTCKGIRFAVKVYDPEGVQSVIMQFKVGFDPTPKDFTNPDAQLELSNEGNDLWGGYFNDTISEHKNVTNYRFIAFDKNGISTLFYIAGKFSYYASDFGCITIVPG